MGSPMVNKGLNRYTCDICEHSIVTVDRQPGVTPMFLSCKSGTKCSGMMRSAGYVGVTGEPTYEWRKPTPAERKKLSPAMQEHVDLGGLCLYPIAVKEVSADV